MKFHNFLKISLQNEFDIRVVGMRAVRGKGEAAIQQSSSQEASGQVVGPGGGEHPHQVHHTSDDKFEKQL